MADRGRCRMCHLDKDLRQLPVQGDPEHKPVVCAGCFRALDVAVGVFAFLGYDVKYSQMELEIPELAPDSTETNGKEPRRGKTLA